MGSRATLGHMKETGWQAIGRIARARRERMGLKQDELARYEGPGVATVGKFERAVQTPFPLRTQHQMEKALGWSRTIIEQVVKSIDDGSLTAADWEHDLVEEDIPDLSRPVIDSGDRQLGEAVDAFRSVLRLIDPDRRDVALRAALVSVLPLLTADGAARLGASLRDSFPPVTLDQAGDMSLKPGVSPNLAKLGEMMHGQAGVGEDEANNGDDREGNAAGA